jgi:hypothetical protein
MAGIRYCDGKAIAMVGEFYRETCEDIHSVNITAVTLFSALEGFWRTLKFHV